MNIINRSIQLRLKKKAKYVIYAIKNKIYGWIMTWSK